MSMGHRTYLTWKHQGDNSMCGKRKGNEGVVDACSARPAWHGKSYTARIPVLGGALDTRRLERLNTARLSLLVLKFAAQGQKTGPQQSSEREPPASEAGQGTNGMPTPRYDVQQQRTMGSPKGREPYGDGASIVVKCVQPARINE